MSICAVVITFHPDSGVIENMIALLGEVDKVIVVDNGSDAPAQEFLKRFACDPKVDIIYNAENRGIAAALNQGVLQAKNMGYEWVITFDQDSKVTVGMVGAMLDAYAAYPEKNRIASLSPRYRDISSGRIGSSSKVVVGKSSCIYSEPLVVITSGNLIKSEIFDAVGLFNEDLFIDHVDTEFCLRCAISGYKILEVYNAILEHSLGAPTLHRLLWKTPITSNHTPLRRYYNARNGIYVYKKFLFDYPYWVISHAYIYLKTIIVLMLFERNRMAKLSAICRGVVDGFLGRFGKV